MDRFEYYSLLRSEILDIISGVENADDSLCWDNTKPNYITKRELENLYSKYIDDAKNFGVYIVTRHSGCPNPKHGEYPTSNKYGRSIPYRNKEYVWNGGQIYQGPRLCVCPCSEKNKLTEHWVIDDIVYEKSANLEKSQKLENILSDIDEAIDCAGDKKPRSAIREYLLRAIIRIDDELLPEPMDKYIQIRMNSLREP